MKLFGCPRFVISGLILLLGWHPKACGNGEGGHTLPTSIQPSPPYRLWYQPQFIREKPTLYRYTNYVSTAGNNHALAHVDLVRVSGDPLEKID